MIRLTRPQKKLLLYFGIGSGVLLGFFLFLILPKAVHVKELTREIDLSLADYYRIQKVILTADHSGERFRTILKQIEDYHQMVPRSELMPELLSKIAGLAQRNGLEVVSLAPKEHDIFLSTDSKPFEEDGRIVEEQTLLMELRGNFYSLGHFVNLLEEGPYKILIKKVMIKNEDYPNLETRGRNLLMHLTLGLLTRTESAKAG